MRVRHTCCVTRPGTSITGRRSLCMYSSWAARRVLIWIDSILAERSCTRTCSSRLSRYGRLSRHLWLNLERTIGTVANGRKETFRLVFILFSTGWYLCARKSPYALHPVSQNFSQCRLWNGSSVRLIDDGLSRLFKEDRLAGPLSTHIASRRSILSFSTSRHCAIRHSGLYTDRVLPV